MESSVASIACRWSSVSLLCVLALACASPRPTPGTESTSTPTEATLPTYSTADFTAEWLVPGSAAAKNAHRIAAFSFTDQDRRVVTRESLRGKIYVADFFFTGCPSLCPKMTATFKRIQAAFVDDPRVVLVSHSVDPTTDTPDRLAEFAQKNGVISGKWHLLTGDQGEIYELARTSYFAEKRPGLNKAKGEFLHTENMLLVDGEGRLRGIYDATLPAEAGRVIEDIGRLEKEGG